MLVGVQAASMLPNRNSTRDFPLEPLDTKENGRAAEPVEAFYVPAARPSQS